MTKTILRVYIKKNVLYQPPQNKRTTKHDIKNIFEYSAKKKNAKVTLEYSVEYPATNSASASGKSNGCRFVSAKITIKNISSMGNNGNKLE